MNDGFFKNIRDKEKLLPEDEFFSEFDKAWERMRHTFFKLESLQDYDEGEESGFPDFQNRDYKRFAAKARKARFEEKEMYEAAQRRGTSFLRLRIVRYPLTKYTEFEFYTYFISREMGEQIRFIESDELEKDVPDLVLFDDFALFVYDYDGTELKGGYCIYDRDRVKAASDLVHGLFKQGKPFEQMMEADPDIVKDLVKEE